MNVKKNEGKSEGKECGVKREKGVIVEGGRVNM
jgi:hypothetical protein